MLMLFLFSWTIAGGNLYPPKMPKRDPFEHFIGSWYSHRIFKQYFERLTG